MTDQELLQAIGQVVEAKLEPMRKDICELKDDVTSMNSRMKQLEADVSRVSARMDRLEFNMDRVESRIKLLEHGVDQLGIRADDLEEKVNGIRICMDTDQQRTLNLLLEGQQALWDRFVPHEKFGPIVDRTEVLEATARRHSQEIRELRERRLA